MWQTLGHRPDPTAPLRRETGRAGGPATFLCPVTTRPPLLRARRHPDKGQSVSPGSWGQPMGRGKRNGRGLSSPAHHRPGRPRGFAGVPAAHGARLGAQIGSSPLSRSRKLVSTCEQYTRGVESAMEEGGRCCHFQSPFSPGAGFLFGPGWVGSPTSCPWGPPFGHCGAPAGKGGDRFGPHGAFPARPGIAFPSLPLPPSWTPVRLYFQWQRTRAQSGMWVQRLPLCRGPSFRSFGYS